MRYRTTKLMEVVSDEEFSNMPGGVVSNCRIIWRWFENPKDKGLYIKVYKNRIPSNNVAQSGIFTLEAAIEEVAKGNMPGEILDPQLIVKYREV